VAGFRKKLDFNVKTFLLDKKAHAQLAGKGVVSYCIRLPVQGPLEGPLQACNSLCVIIVAMT
jgi:hypothetical protein